MRHIKEIMIVAVCLMVLSFCVCTGFGIYFMYREGVQEYEDLRTYVKETDEDDHTEGTDGSDGKQTVVDFRALKKINPDIVAWIRIPDTSIDYPVVQGNDDSYYLTHTFKKAEHVAGAIFLDSDNSADFSDDKNIIYGHNMKDGSMFRGLRNFLDDEFLKEHHGNDFAEFTGDEAETDGWIQSEQVEGLAFKYDANNQTLYLKSEKAVALPDYKQSGWTSEWRNKYGAELNNVKTIEIQGEITQIGEFNFNNGRAGAYDNLETVKLSPSVTKIAASAFGEVATLKSINLNKVKEIGTAAFWKTGLENVTLDDEETIIADNAFSECTSLTSVTVKGIKSLGMNAYDGCTSLSTFNCEGNIESIPMKCFQNTGITAFDFKNVSSVGRNAFNKSNLKSACYAGTKEQWDSMIPAASWSGATIPEGTVVHCKADAVEAKDATCTEDGWKEVGICEVCGEHYSYPTDENVIPATGHTWSEDYVVDKEATCTEAGEKSKHCTICDAKEDVQEIPALGHDFVSKVTKKANLKNHSIQKCNCSERKESDTEASRNSIHIPSEGYLYKFQQKDCNRFFQGRCNRKEKRYCKNNSKIRI